MSDEELAAIKLSAKLAAEESCGDDEHSGHDWFIQDTVPSLIAEVERLRAEHGRLRALLDRLEWFAEHSPTCFYTVGEALSYARSDEDFV